MFEIGWTEILVIAIVAIVVFPSKDLPRLLRTAGQMVGKVRKMAGEFQGQFNAALREAERELDLEETRKKVEDLKSLNPMNQVKDALNPLSSSVTDIKKTIAAPASTSQFVPPPAVAAAPPPVVEAAPPAAVPPAGNPTLAPVAGLAPKEEPAPAPKTAGSRSSLRATVDDAVPVAKPVKATTRAKASEPAAAAPIKPAKAASATAPAKAKAKTAAVAEPDKPKKPRVSRKPATPDGDAA